MDIEVIKPYILWGAIVVATFIGVIFITTDITRKYLQLKIQKVFPLQEAPLTPTQIRLLQKKMGKDLHVLAKDLKEWKLLGDERKLTECKHYINHIRYMEQLVHYKILTTRQIRDINEYMLNEQPVWMQTEVKYKHVA